MVNSAVVAKPVAGTIQSPSCRSDSQVVSSGKDSLHTPYGMEALWATNYSPAKSVDPAGCFLEWLACAWVVRYLGVILGWRCMVAGSLGSTSIGLDSQNARDNGPISQNREYRQYSPKRMDPMLPILSSSGIFGHGFGHFGGPRQCSKVGEMPEDAKQLETDLKPTATAVKCAELPANLSPAESMESPLLLLRNFIQVTIIRM